jgi:hypothetical protein
VGFKHSTSTSGNPYPQQWAVYDNAQHLGTRSVHQLAAAVCSAACMLCPAVCRCRAFRGGWAQAQVAVGLLGTLELLEGVWRVREQVGWGSACTGLGFCLYWSARSLASPLVKQLGGLLHVPARRNTQLPGSVVPQFGRIACTGPNSRHPTHMVAHAFSHSSP